MLHDLRRQGRRYRLRAVTALRSRAAQALQTLANDNRLHLVVRKLVGRRFPERLPRRIEFHGWFADDDAATSSVVQLLSHQGRVGQDRARIKFCTDHATDDVMVSGASAKSVRLVQEFEHACDPVAIPDAIDVSVGRPVQFPQRGRGTLTIDAFPRFPGDDLARLVRDARSAERVLIAGDTVAEHLQLDVLLVLAAAGAPIELINPSDSHLELVGLDTFKALTAAYEPGARERELRSIRIRRSALSEHSPNRRFSDIAARVGVPIPSPHTMSVLLASRRLNLLPGAVEQVAAQVGCEAQLLIGVHGVRHTSGDLDRIRALWPGDLVVGHFDEEVALGSILDELARRADGSLLVKWDDDDWYGPDHLADLVLAHDYSGAEVVGKAAEFVYLEGSDETIRRSALGAESYSPTLAGGTLLMSKAWLEHLGGWPTARQRVDRYLIQATHDAGGATYRTHGFQYVLRRSKNLSDHTWKAPDDYFRSTASEARPGLDLAFADIETQFAARSTTNTSYNTR